MNPWRVAQFGSVSGQVTALTMPKHWWMHWSTAATVTTFSDGESLVQIDENVRGMDVFLVQTLSYPILN
ncbi:MAG: ribose-phosphate pyrophosphokinase-like domain-containing protein [Mariprofundus sp.]